MGHFGHSQGKTGVILRVIEWRLGEFNYDMAEGWQE